MRTAISNAQLSITRMLVFLFNLILCREGGKYWKEREGAPKSKGQPASKGFEGHNPDFWEEEIAFPGREWSAAAQEREMVVCGGE